jgi:hypothetical protein
MLGLNWHRAEDRAAELAKTTAPFDWSGVSSRDLNIAAVFLTARDVGVGRAMDSLLVLQASDTTFRTDGHMIAHSLGRFAIAKNHNDPSILAQCRPTFQAGCYHGVLEGYLSSLPKVDATATAQLCVRLIRPDSSRFAGTECAHGLGHGFAEAFGYEIAAALTACDVFADVELKSECHDGVFMENTVHGLGASGMNVGDDAMGSHMHMVRGASKGIGFRASDLRFPCDSVPARYQPSCWSYQPVVIASLTSNDFERTLHECASAPPQASANCYRGFGKQSLAWFGWNYSRVSATCNEAGEHASDCIAGAVEGLVDLSLSSSPAAAFCNSTSSVRHLGCFEEIGALVARVKQAEPQVSAECDVAVKPELIEACVRGSRRSGARG